MPQAETSKFQSWYAKPKNRKSLNQRRRERYRDDPSYRNRVLKGTRKWRKLNPTPPKPSGPKTHFSIGEVAERIRCEQKTIRTLEKAGLIPDSRTDGQTHRRFTENQITLITMLVEFRRNTHYRDPKYQAGLKKLAKQAHKGW